MSFFCKSFSTYWMGILFLYYWDWRSWWIISFFKSKERA